MQTLRPSFLSYTHASNTREYIAISYAFFRKKGFVEGKERIKSQAEKPGKTSIAENPQLNCVFYAVPLREILFQIAKEGRPLSFLIGFAVFL